MTTNHPANGPVSLDRLHQIRQYIERNNQYQNGGNLAYILTDMLKVIDEVLEARNAEQVEFLPDNLDRALTILGVALPISKEEFNLDAERWMQRLINRVIRLESELTPPAPVVPDEIKHRIGGLDWGWEGEFNRGWNACRTAMLQAEPVSNHDELPLDYLQGHKDGLEWAAQLAEANHPQTGDWLYDDPIELARAIRKGPDMPTVQTGNSPVTPDGWIPVSERIPERDVDVQVYCADKKEQMVGYMERNETEGWFRFASLPNGGGVYCKPTHWMELPAAPQQEDL
ncbi:DUF551 domain-containing protein [Citrobacter portucalensis]|nr:DUF551 domain-containing protein [Citrobacter portucalensis]MDE9663525.1 DUF551 domain-containing protein [Citrobacter portucalensis]MDE9672621.1 DUF551 domain-containing protein [Citrobacter portucalensis]